MTIEEVKKRLRFDDKDKIDEAINVASQLSEKEEERRSTFESKATTLVGFAGLSATIVVGFGSVLVDRQKIFTGDFLLLAGC